ncbi:bifunctional adenosylcobinamide kinase/adenosylcobinamide-phosphate guanylyltransferase [Sedimenticola selenatireducens]|uniref:Bifunctional adenosylcobalamin biosynthesis protein n=1 Tax=Sedimenticola selenatireducens TaxID=191960 RepID=A0A558E1J0_9GAMM|nr:bifunctional adenosylcobinamide kinase/adenosylcobinamide-phosphate guanylyltransferase [Sedimenticola selenatireducens]TVO79001.1 bifunctional adenosylcobinamide kinase/adenosylcobinamide-phosphate guanylyltransferase [Sedimenticola selenatireducens]TVT67207.1 MAG: bifunctional adenosylcobinamide kinase/adenosylcobinamide-phosphate guanylyltransferase [Sedimenticola selenatireducens]
MIQLILGGARSGKSTLAERLASGLTDNVVYIATAARIADDLEMIERINLHRERRPTSWTLVEEPLDLASAIETHQRMGCCIIVDCLTLWLSNIMLLDEGRHFKQQVTDLFSVLSGFQGNLILVGNEVGMGIVPMGKLSRRFQDESGRLHQQLATLCDRVVLTVAGLPLVMKGEKI